MYALPVRSFVGSKTITRHFLVYAFPCLFIWSIYFLAFYPGMMSQDSIDQWRPVVTFKFSDWHPASLSYLYWLLTCIWLSPAIICIVQMLGMALVFAYGMVQLEKKGLPARGLVLMVMFFSLFPLNGFFVNTLFKDIPFSIAYLLAFIYLLVIVESGGAWLEKIKNVIWFSLALSFIWVIRHNGILTVFTVIGGLLFFYPRYFKKIGLLALLTLSLVFLVKGPLYKAINAQGRFYGFEMIMTHQISAVIHSRAKIYPEEKAFLQQILPLSVWQYNYDPFVIDPLIFNKHFKNYYSFLYPEANRNKFKKVWFNIARRNIPTLLKHQIKVTDLVWNIGLQKGSFNYSIHPLIDANNLGLAMQSFLPNLKNRLWAFHEYAYYHNAFLLAIFFRPATYIYSSIILVLFLYKFTRRKEIILLALPFVTLVAGVFLAIPAQHVRYLYPCFLLTPFYAAYLAIILRNRRRPVLEISSSVKKPATL